MSAQFIHFIFCWRSMEKARAESVSKNVSFKQKFNEISKHIFLILAWHVKMGSFTKNRVFFSYTETVRIKGKDFV